MYICIFQFIIILHSEVALCTQNVMHQMKTTSQIIMSHVK